MVAELAHLGVPWPMILIMLLLAWSTNVSHEPIGFADFFSGEEAQTAAFREDNHMRGHSHDIRNGRAFDFLANAGFALAANSVGRLQPHGIAPLGPTCSSWVFLSRSSSKRNYLYPIGCEDLDWVHAGNLMASRVCLLLLLIVYAQCTFLLEQPASSLFSRHHRFVMVVKLLRGRGVKMFRQTVNLGAFGSASRKPLHLFSNNWGLLKSLWRPLTFSDTMRFAANTANRLVVKSVSKQGVRQVTGVASALRKSQSCSYRCKLDLVFVCCHADVACLHQYALSILVYYCCVIVIGALRAYPCEYGRAVATAFSGHSTVGPPPPSATLTPASTDREIFDDLVLTTTDVWDDVWH